MTAQSIALQRHAARRRQGVPTISVGATETFEDAVGRDCRVAAAATGDELAQVWLAQVRRQGSLDEAVDRWMIAHTGGSFTSGTATVHDFQQAWQAASPPSGPTAQWVYNHVLARLGRPQSPAAFDWLDTFRAVEPLLDEPPGLVLRPATDHWAVILRCLERLAVAVPTLPLLLVASPSELAPFLQAADRLATLLREGLIADEPGLTALPVAEDPAPVPLPGCPYASPEEEDHARSEAERWLFERLESTPDLAGLFALNQRLEFLHGPAPAEADLLARSLRLVIEIDGAYFHLAKLDNYRRDRRKDWEYQRHGYLVLRFLAEDVRPDADAILATIRAAVAFRRAAAARLSTEVD